MLLMLVAVLLLSCVVRAEWYLGPANFDCKNACNNAGKGLGDGCNMEPQNQVNSAEKLEAVATFFNAPVTADIPFTAFIAGIKSIAASPRTKAWTEVIA